MRRTGLLGSPRSHQYISLQPNKWSKNWFLIKFNYLQIHRNRLWFFLYPLPKSSVWFSFGLKHWICNWCLFHFAATIVRGKKLNLPYKNPPPDTQHLIQSDLVLFHYLKMVFPLWVNITDKSWVHETVD